MKYRTVFRPEARTEMRKLPQKTAMGIFRKLAELETDPYAFGTTALVGSPELRRLRVGDYRVIYTLKNGDLIIWVLHVGHRSSVYE
ncbi:type II toxin-antitoxin system RelE family toxin [Murinocardiopsis flavida]|uniref:type II toxin-antitoxin system RelE family toxin n=1 Tax=Murinocardiopsis flavida TaxID=645275 RepID=UPI001B801A47|nr:type II toxin-antitoxin system RelE/ParE family toxin [Murinocardiopsis flavida]